MLAISALKNGLLNTVRRFPATIFVAIIATLLSWHFIYIEDYQNHFVTPIWAGDRNNYRAHIFTFLSLCSLAMPLTFAAHVLVDMGKKRLGFMAFGAILLLLVSFYFAINRKIDTEQDFLFFALWCVATHFLAAIPAFNTFDELNGFWQWNKQLFIRFLTSALYSSVLYAGISIALLAVKMLFNFDIKPVVFGYLFAAIGILFQTTFFLGGISEPIADLQQTTDYPKGLKFFTQYVLLPLLLLYFAILYLYMGKIIVNFSLPKGSVCYLILGFSVVGILSLLLLHPLLDDEKEAKWVRTVG